MNGIRAVQKKGFLERFLNESADISSLQETKAQKDQLDKSLVNIDGYESYWCSAERKGYGGVAIYLRTELISVQSGFKNPRFDVEGWVLIAEYPRFVPFNVYFPNGKRDQQRLSSINPRIVAAISGIREEADHLR